MSDGGMTVTKTTTGTILIEDIKLYVEHARPTFVPADQVLNSRDLHRALNSKVIFQLLNTMPLAPKAPDTDRQFILEDENRALREALIRSTQQGSALQATMETLGKQVQVLTEAVGKIGTGTVQASTGPRMAAQPVNEAVGGETPMFLPDTITAVDDLQVQVKEQVSEGDGVAAAGKRLRELRKGKTL